MNYFIKKLMATLPSLKFNSTPVAVPLTDSGLDGPCYYHQEGSDWETMGAVAGILGAFLLAINAGYGGYGWLAFLASNLCWISFAALNRFRMLFWQQIAFLASTALGLYNSFYLGF